MVAMKLSLTAASVRNYHIIAVDSPGRKLNLSKQGPIRVWLKFPIKERIANRERHLSEDFTEDDDRKPRTAATRAKIIGEIGSLLRTTFEPPAEMSPELAALIAQLKD
jgi:hypothetical protein